MDESGGVSLRILKVGRTTQVRGCGHGSVVPFIRLSGKWLERAGFLENDMIAVAAVNGEIRIVRQDEKDAPGRVQWELF